MEGGEVVVREEGPGVFNLERCAPCSFCWEDHDKPAHCHLGVPDWCRGPKHKELNGLV